MKGKRFDEVLSQLAHFGLNARSDISLNGTILALDRSYLHKYALDPIALTSLGTYF